jgi:hypothetical protein
VSDAMRTAMPLDDSSAPNDPIVACYENQVPSFVDAALDRLYGSIYSTIGMFYFDGSIAKAHTYVASINGEPTSVLLYRCERNVVTVLNGSITLSRAEMERFARTIFTRYKRVSAIVFNAIRHNISGTSYPYQRYIYGEDIVAELPETPERYFANLGRNMRETVKRFQNRLKRNHPDFRFQAYVNDEADENQIRDLAAARAHRKQEQSLYRHRRRNRTHHHSCQNARAGNDRHHRWQGMRRHGVLPRRRQFFHVHDRSRPEIRRHETRYALLLLHDLRMHRTRRQSLSFFPGTRAIQISFSRRRAVARSRRTVSLPTAYIPQCANGIDDGDRREYQGIQAPVAEREIKRRSQLACRLEVPACLARNEATGQPCLPDLGRQKRIAADTRKIRRYTLVTFRLARSKSGNQSTAALDRACSLRAAG